MKKQKKSSEVVVEPVAPVELEAGGYRFRVAVVRAPRLSGDAIWRARQTTYGPGEKKGTIDARSELMTLPAANQEAQRFVSLLEGAGATIKRKAVRAAKPKKVGPSIEEMAARVAALMAPPAPEGE